MKHANRPLNIGSDGFSPSPPDEAATPAALRATQEAMNRFFRGFKGLIAQESFFNPDNIQEFMSAAAVRAGNRLRFKQLPTFSLRPQLLDGLWNRACRSNALLRFPSFAVLNSGFNVSY
jgi:hypothetical protein